jgi:pyrroline-5-carboxylate reductase
MKGEETVGESQGTTRAKSFDPVLAAVPQVRHFVQESVAGVTDSWHVPLVASELASAVALQAGEAFQVQVESDPDALRVVFKAGPGPLAAALVQLEQGWRRILLERLTLSVALEGDSLEVMLPLGAPRLR